MNKKAIAIIIAAVVAITAFMLFTEPKDATGSPSNHKAGKGTSGVTLTEFGDFQCPACAQFYPILNQVKDYYGDKITFQFRHYPIENAHPNARAASMAAEAASRQDKFWEMHNKLYENQNAWSNTNDPVGTFKSYAKELGLDEDKFVNDYKNSEMTTIINSDMQIAKDKDVNATPSFLINDKKIEKNPGTLEEFKKIIDKAIEEVAKTRNDDKQDSNNNDARQGAEKQKDN